MPDSQRSRGLVAQNTDDWMPARREARLVAGAVDLLVVAALGAGCAVLALAVMLVQVNPLRADPTLNQWLVGYAVAALALPAAPLYIALATLRGGTLGARLLGLRVQGGSGAVLARALLWWPGWIALVALWSPWLDPHGRALVDRLTGAPLLERCAPAPESTTPESTASESTTS